ncbi:MAG: alpha-L-fucosidase [Pyrinomonadaceae bacterium]
MGILSKQTAVLLTAALIAFGGIAKIAAQSKEFKLPVNSPAPYGPLPTPRQVAWHEMESYAFIHFTTNTFTGKEWGYGDESPAVFNPTDFDADQIVAAVKAAGFKGITLTAKHHDGFCLWPSKFTEHSVKNSPWKNGKGDVVREIAKACRRAGLKFGIYISPWDRNRADYGTPGYVTYYRKQLRELLSNYGDIFMVWLDGANGGDGYYGGARETRRIDNKTYYDWPNTISIVRQLQPNAVIFSDAGPDVRWLGNERGMAPDVSWHTLNRAAAYPGMSGGPRILPTGHRDGTDWVPAEADVSIRPGWFYHAEENTSVKTPGQLLDIYYNSVGRGASLHLNFPPDQRGRIHDIDAANAREMRRILNETFAGNLAANAKVSASTTRRGAFAAANVIDDNRKTFWAAPDDVKSAELIFEMPKPVTFDVVMLQEVIELGQRLDGFSLDVWENNAWREILKKESVGYKRLDRLDAKVTAAGIRLRLNAPVPPVLASFGLYLQPEIPKTAESGRQN